MSRLYGISAAFYGNEPRKVTTTVISGATKRDISVSSTKTLPINEPSEIVGAIDYLVQGTKNAAASSKKIRHPVVVVYGVEATTYADDLLEHVSSAYGRLISTQNTSTEPPRFYKNSVSPSVSMNGFPARYKLVSSVRDILSGSVRSSPVLQVEGRIYFDNREMLDFDYETACRMTLRSISPKVRQYFDELQLQIALGNSSVKADLEALVQSVARNFALPVKRNLAGKNPSSRFFGTGTPPDLSPNGDIRNVIFSNNELRRVYAEAFHGLFGDRS